jgi:hypothetical protein
MFSSEQRRKDAYDVHRQPLLERAARRYGGHPPPERWSGPHRDEETAGQEETSVDIGHHPRMHYFFIIIKILLFINLLSYIF